MSSDDTMCYILAHITGVSSMSRELLKKTWWATVPIFIPLYEHLNKKLSTGYCHNLWEIAFKRSPEGNKAVEIWYVCSSKWRPLVTLRHTRDMGWGFLDVEDISGKDIEIIEQAWDELQDKLPSKIDYFAFWEDGYKDNVWGNIDCFMMDPNMPVISYSDKIVWRGIRKTFAKAKVQNYTINATTEPIPKVSSKPTVRNRYLDIQRDAQKKVSQPKIETNEPSYYWNSDNAPTTISQQSDSVFPSSYDKLVARLVGEKRLPSLDTAGAVISCLARIYRLSAEVKHKEVNVVKKIRYEMIAKDCSSNWDNLVEILTKQLPSNQERI